MQKEKSIIRRFLSDDKFRKIHDEWSLGIKDRINTNKTEWNFGIILRNYTRDMFEKMIERILEIEKEKLSNAKA